MKIAHATTNASEISGNRSFNYLGRKKKKKKKKSNVSNIKSWLVS